MTRRALLAGTGAPSPPLPAAVDTITMEHVRRAMAWLRAQDNAPPHLADIIEDDLVRALQAWLHKGD